MLFTRVCESMQVLVPGSHRCFATWSTKYPNEVNELRIERDFFAIPASDDILTGGIHTNGDASAPTYPPYRPVICKLERGDLLVWDSRTVHASQPATVEPSKEKSSDLLRLAMLMCMVTRDRVPADVMQQRKDAVTQWVTTTHRPHLFQPSYDGDTYRTIPKTVFQQYTMPTDTPRLNRQMKLLVGYTKNDLSALDHELPHERSGEFLMRGFTFHTGESMDLRICYSSLGTLRRDPTTGRATNAVLVLHGTTGSGSDFLRAENARQSFVLPLFGADKILDANSHFIVFPDAIGHGASSRPGEEGGLRMSFPKYDYSDMCRAHYALLTEHLGVDHLLLVMGTSMGGMHTWMMGMQYPSFMDALFPLASLPVAIAGVNRMVRKSIVDAIREDPDFQNGMYDDAKRHSIRGHKFAVRMMALRMSSTPKQWYAQAPTRLESEAMLDTITAQYIAKIEPTDMVYAFEASRNYDPAPTLLSIVAPLTAVNSMDDQTNPPELCVLEQSIARLNKAGRDAKAVVIPISDATRGHGSHTIAALWHDELENLLQRARAHTNAPLRDENSSH